jgi:hypothetical protein
MGNTEESLLVPNPKIGETGREVRTKGVNYVLLGDVISTGLVALCQN